MIHDLEKKFKDIQSYIHKKFSDFEDSNDIDVSRDEWKRPEGGGGITQVIANGNFFDNCAINFSSIYGKDLPKAALAKTLSKKAEYGYRAMGISVISHPKNPHIPTSHMNVRIFAILDQNNDIADWWIGGGYDLTPFLPYEEDIIQWHSSAKASLEPFGRNFYEDFSNNCNKYFEIPHRNERRGVGGIFFDNLTDFTSINESMKFLKSVAECYVDSYSSIINKRKETQYDEIQKEFQLFRRGRYAEFNLIYDRGTSFGLQSNGRIESILASLPSDVKWSYKKSPEYDLLQKNLLNYINKDWNV